VLTGVEFADEASIENADVRRVVGRGGDGVLVTVTLFGLGRGPSVSGARHGDGRRRAGTGPDGGPLISTSAG
jgi:hypothetical protein